MTPCGSAFTDDQNLRDRLMVAADALFTQHSSDGIYTQDRAGEPCCRWEGIRHATCPPDAPQKSDCSSAVTWIYWTVLGNGPDFLNGDNWNGGYTGTLSSHGQVIPCENMQKGDPAFFPGHVNMYIGDGQCVDHGSAPVRHVSLGSPRECRTYIP